MIAISDLEAYLQQDLTDYGTEAQAACDQATAVVEDHCKRSFAQVENDAITIRWRPAIVLPNPPVTEITSVEVDGVASDYDIDDSGRLWMRSSGDQIAIVYTHGYETIPDTVRLVALRLAARIFKNPVGRVSYSVDNASMQMSQDVSPRVLTSDEMATLRRYRLHSAR